MFEALIVISWLIAGGATDRMTITGTGIVDEQTCITEMQAMVEKLKARATQQGIVLMTIEKTECRPSGQGV